MCRAFLDVSLLVGKEWNRCGLDPVAPSTFDPCPKTEVSFDPQWIVSAAWGIPSAPVRAAEVPGLHQHQRREGQGLRRREDPHRDPDAHLADGRRRPDGLGRKNTFLMGVGYEYWRNKFGNHGIPGVEVDAPTFQAEWHF